MMPTTWLPLTIGALISLLAPFAIRPLLHQLRTIDVPNERSSHSAPTLRGGGLAPLLGWVIGGVIAITQLDAPASTYLTVLVVGGAVMGIIGLAEDVQGLSIAIRAGSQMLIGAILAIALVLETSTPWWTVPLAGIAFAFYVNVANFMDGINGITSLYGLVAGLGYAMFGLLSDLPWLSMAGLLIAGVYIVFLPWNLVPPGMFLGDAGSYLIGGAVGGTAIACLFVGLPPLTTLAPLSIYLADSILTLLRRGLRGEPLLRPHRTHTYQRLVGTGLSHMQVASIVALFTALSIGSGMLVDFRVIPGWGGLSILIVLMCIYVGLPSSRGDRQVSRHFNSLLPVPLPASLAKRSDWLPTAWAIIGGNGFIGSATAKYLKEAGDRVILLSAPRVSLDTRGGDAAAVAELAANHPETQSLAMKLKGVDVVVNAAGLATPDSEGGEALYGANSLLPAIVVLAAGAASAGRVIHLSSAAVQGRRPVLDTSLDAEPFSEYSRSKALGERSALAAGRRLNRQSGTDVVIIRATSVQGEGRATTQKLRRIARSPLASVASPGTQPSVVSSVAGLVKFIRQVSVSREPVGPIELQPWEGLSVSDVLTLPGGRRPIVLPRWVCVGLLSLGHALGRLVPRLAGAVRRVEMMWLGQSQAISSNSVVRGEEIRTLLSKGN